MVERTRKNKKCHHCQKIGKDAGLQEVNSGPPRDSSFRNHVVSLKQFDTNSEQANDAASSMHWTFE